MTWLELINPSQPPRIEAEMFRLARGNSVFTVLGVLSAAALVGLGLHAYLDPARLAVWELLMLCTAVAGWRAHQTLHSVAADAMPGAAILRRWRDRQAIAFLLEATAWGGLGLLFDPAQPPVLNALFLLIYLAIVAAGGRASGAHSFRLYVLLVIESLCIMLPCLPAGFGEFAPLLALLVAAYAAFVVKVSHSEHRTLLHTIALQIENEQLHQQRLLAQQAAERERIYRDLHDDVGAKLLGLSIAAQRAGMTHEADLARSALQDLRDVVSRSMRETTGLEELLADWRAETSQRATSAGLAFSWQVPAPAAAIEVGAPTTLHLTRLLREAVSNVLHHARASRLHIHAQWLPDRLILQIEDDGIGLPEQPLPGRGMSGMRTRASALGGHIIWQQGQPQGCRVIFEMPLPPLVAESLPAAT